jgi:hypothetical protein
MIWFKYVGLFIIARKFQFDVDVYLKVYFLELYSFFFFFRYCSNVGLIFGIILLLILNGSWGSIFVLLWIWRFRCRFVVYFIVFRQWLDEVLLLRDFSWLIRKSFLYFILCIVLWFSLCIVGSFYYYFIEIVIFLYFMY